MVAVQNRARRVQQDIITYLLNISYKRFYFKPYHFSKHWLRQIFDITVVLASKIQLILKHKLTKNKTKSLPRNIKTYSEIPKNQTSRKSNIALGSVVYVFGHQTLLERTQTSTI